MYRLPPLVVYAVTLPNAHILPGTSDTSFPCSKQNKLYGLIMQISDRVPHGRVYRSLAVASAILIVLSIVGMVSWSLWRAEPAGAVSAVICAFTFVLGVLGTVLVGNVSRRATVSDMNPTAYVINLASLPASSRLWLTRQ